MGLQLSVGNGRAHLRGGTYYVSGREYTVLDSPQTNEPKSAHLVWRSKMNLRSPDMRDKFSCLAAGLEEKLQRELGWIPRQRGDAMVSAGSATAGPMSWYWYLVDSTWTPTS